MENDLIFLGMEDLYPCRTVCRSHEDLMAALPDYSELITEPDLVLSMHDIYVKYAATGKVPELNMYDEYSDIDDDMEFDDKTDVLYQSQYIRDHVFSESDRAAAESANARRQGAAKPTSASGHEAAASAEPEPADEPAE